MALFLVTGGCGFIGSHLAETLVDRGHRVRVLDDLSTGDPANLPPSATLITGDVRNPKAVSRALEGVDGCFHLAAVVSVTRCERQWQHAHEVNLTAAVNLFRQARQGRSGAPIPVVYASSAAVYGDARTLPVREDAPARPINAYGADKAACELHAGAIARATGAPITGLRFFNVYGPGQDPSSVYSGVVSIFCERLLTGQPIDIYGDGRQTRDFIHVSDVVEAMLKAMELPSTAGDVYNVCTGEALSVLELAKAIAKLCGTRLETRFHPARGADIQHSVGDPGRAVAALDFRHRISVMTGLADLISTSSGPKPVGTERATFAAQ